MFLWLRPPRSILPSRPPSELVAAFCVTGMSSCCGPAPLSIGCRSSVSGLFFRSGGGIAFLLSTEQVVYGAMRSGWGQSSMLPRRSDGNAYASANQIPVSWRADDLMSFLTFTVSLTYFLFGWLFLVLVARGWADRRNVPRTGRDSDSSISDGSGTSSPLRDEGASV